ncbi:MAG TPA: hypothetical protein VFC82_06665 [Actinomycetaceae bacterium]|nr:hypothetical protein [Actinomycetaceae bacterium]
MITRESIREARLRAAQAHGALLGDVSACVRTKSGQTFPAGKFWEGRTAALSELLRSSSGDLGAEAERLQREWTERSIPGNTREAESYRRGGLEALADLIESGS